jgi:hypothetical protein
MSSVQSRSKYGITDSEIMQAVQNERDTRKRPPSVKDINYFERLLKQFGIKETAPDFDTYAELELWFKKVRNKKFDSI